MKYKVRKIWSYDNGHEPIIPRGWEPFGRQYGGDYGCWIWLRKQLVSPKKEKDD